jgi:uncharacterized membrane protein YjjB (DUF3815 family)
MDMSAILINSFWAGLFAASLGVVLTTLPQTVLPCFLCGLVGRFVRNVLVGYGLTPHASVVIAAAVCVAVSTIVVKRRQDQSAIALVTGILPLGASVALFNTIGGTLKLASLKGDALTVASTQLVANLTDVLATTLAIVLGLLAGYVLLWPFKPREKALERRR